MIVGVVCVALSLLFPVTVFPFLTTGKSLSKDNFLDTLDQSFLAVKIAKFCAFFSVALCYPLNLIPLRRSITALLRGARPYADDLDEKRWRFGVSFVVIVVTCIIAVRYNTLGLVMDLTGAMGCNAINFTLPSFLFLCSFSPALGGVFVGEDNVKRMHVQQRPGPCVLMGAWIMFFGSILFFPLGVWVTLQ